MIDITSSFPKHIDKRFVLSDISIDQVKKFEEHKRLINAGLYDAAVDYIYEHDLPAYISDIFNALENRLEATEKYLFDRGECKSYTHYGSEAPEKNSENFIWISST